MKGARWTEADIARLIVMYRCDVALIDIAEQLDRTCHAAVAQMTKLRLLKTEMELWGSRKRNWWHIKQGRNAVYINFEQLCAWEGLRLQRERDKNEDLLRPS